MTNFCGYDISPDMVRLSRVNLYLHGFAQPRIHEYDTLTTEERWDERFDVIMANPPFMTPKGGIRPHNRFSIKANRSEVLFVDYIAEHLNSGGRAGVIVPEGIIFQSQNAYKALRKMLVENYLWAVVSLPAGVFNPYSGVKTSILLLDRNLARRTDSVLFVKVQNDGFDLGAQRRPNGKNDLPEALHAILDFRLRIADFPNLQSGNPQCLVVSRQRLFESTDSNLSGDRYRVVVRQISKWPTVRMEEVCKIFNGARPKGGAVDSGVISIGGEHIGKEWGFNFTCPRYIPEAFFNQLSKGVIQKGDVLVVKDGATTGKTGFVDQNFPFEKAAVNEHVFILRSNSRKIMPAFLYFVVRSESGQNALLRHKVGAAQGGINLSISKIEIPLPPLDVQERIVAELEGYRKVIEGAKQVIANYKPMIKIDPEWPMVKMRAVCSTTSGGTPSRSRNEFYNGGSIPWVKSGEVAQGIVMKTEERITAEGLAKSSAKLLPIGTVLVAMYGATAGQVGLLGIDAATNQAVCGILPNDKFVPEFLLYLLRDRTEEMVALSTGGAQPNISQELIRNLNIPLPPLDIQCQIVAELEAERKLVEANRELITRMEGKIKAKLAEVWGEET